MRTHLCGELRPRAHRPDRQRSAAGWRRRREHGEHLAFVDVRDHTGVTQCVVDNAVDVRSEYVVRVTGVVAPAAGGHRQRRTCRPARSSCGTAPSRCSARPSRRRSRSTPAPTTVDENIRLQYRYLDIRRERMQRNLRIRVGGQLGDPPGDGGAGLRRGRDADARAVARPKGAREFLVPSRQQPGSFYALPQSPQLFKQLLMVGRRRPLLPDRPLPARRGPARRPPVRVHAARRRDELRRARTTCSTPIGEAVLAAAEAVAGRGPAARSSRSRGTRR